MPATNTWNLIFLKIYIIYNSIPQRKKYKYNTKPYLIINLMKYVQNLYAKATKQ